MSDRWVPVQGGPSTLTFTVHDLYNSAAVVVANRGTAPARVSVCVGVKAHKSDTNPAAAASENSAAAAAAEHSSSDDAAAQFTLLSDPLGSGMQPKGTADSLQTAYTIVPPDATVVAAVVSPRGAMRALPPGLFVQVFTAQPDTGGGGGGGGGVGGSANVTLAEAETSSREIDQWLKHRRQVENESPSPTALATSPVRK